MDLKQILFRMNFFFFAFSVKTFHSDSITERKEYWSKIKNLGSVVSCVAFDTFLPLSGFHFFLKEALRYNPLLERRKLTPREGKEHVKSHTANYRAQVLDFRPVFFPLCNTI